MLQILFHIHLLKYDIPVYGYGLMLVIAFLACVRVSQWLAVRNGMVPEHFVDATLIALITGIIGARLCHVFENLHEYTRSDLTIWQNLHNIVNTREGGLTFYGGLLFAIPCCIAYGLFRKAKILVGMDVAAVVIMIGLGFGRIGCFLNGCCYGEQCNLPWAVSFPYYSNAYVEQSSTGKIIVPEELQTRGLPINPNSRGFAGNARLAALAASQSALPVHPTELYSSFTAFFLAAILVVYMGLPHIDGRGFALMLMLEGLARYILELIRVEPSVFTIHIHDEVYGLSISMILSLACFVGGIMMWNVLGLLSRRQSSSHLLNAT